jgi:hypothetical protein
LASPYADGHALLVDDWKSPPASSSLDEAFRLKSNSVKLAVEYFPGRGRFSCAIANKPLTNKAAHLLRFELLRAHTELGDWMHHALYVGINAHFLASALVRIQGDLKCKAAPENSGVLTSSSIECETLAEAATRTIF